VFGDIYDDRNIREGCIIGYKEYNLEKLVCLATSMMIATFGKAALLVIKNIT